MSYILFFQCLSSHILKWFTNVTDTTESGSEFQLLTILVLKAFLRTSFLACVLSSFEKYFLRLISGIEKYAQVHIFRLMLLNLGHWTKTL